MIKKSLSLKKKSAKKKIYNLRRKKNLSRRNLKSRNKRGGSVLGLQEGNLKSLQDQIIELAKTVGLKCDVDESMASSKRGDSKEYKALEKLIKKYPDNKESPLKKSYVLEHNNDRDTDNDYYTNDGKLINIILGDRLQNIDYNSRMLNVTDETLNYSQRTSQKIGILKPYGKEAFTKVAEQGPLSGLLDKSFLEINKMLKVPTTSTTSTISAQ